MSKHTNTALPTFVRKPQVRRMFAGMSNKRIDELVDAGLLPAPVRLGQRTVLFRLDELQAAIAAMQQRAAG